MWRIQDFPEGGAPTPKMGLFFQLFAENCMKMKEFGPKGGGARPWRPPLDPPMTCGIGCLSKELHQFDRESHVFCCHFVETEREVFCVFLMVFIATFVMYLRSETSMKVKQYLFHKILKVVNSMCTDVL